MTASAPTPSVANKDANLVLPEFEQTQPSAAAACVLEARPIDDVSGVLRLHQSGAAFVQMDVSEVRVEVPIGETIADVFVELIGLGWHIKGHLDISAFSVHPTSTLSFGGFLRPTQFAKLRVAGARPGQLLLTANPPSFVTPVAALSPEPCACEDVTIGMPPPPMDDEVAQTGNWSRFKRGTLAKRVALRIDPSTEPVAWVNATEEVQVLEQRGDYTRVISTQYVTNVYGWVPTRDVHMLRPHGSEGYKESGIVGTFSQPQPIENPNRGGLALCQTELSLIGLVNGEAMRVGTIEPATVLETTGRDRGLVWLVPPKSVKALNGVKFGVPEAQFAKCAPQ